MWRQRSTGRGLGPFTGGQLTIVIVAIAAMFSIPTAALAASGAFTNNSATVPAVQGTNSNTEGIGVRGTGKKYGVFSNGHLGVAAGKKLKCKGCVTSGDVAFSAVRNMRPGEEMSGAFGASDVYPAATPGHLTTTINFVQPLAENRGIPLEFGPSAHCPAIARPTPGYFCVFAATSDVAFESTTPVYKYIVGGHFKVVGHSIRWTELGGGEASVAGMYRYVAP
jgi:hypothetical protein